MPEKPSGSEKPFYKNGLIRSLLIGVLSLSSGACVTASQSIHPQVAPCPQSAPTPQTGELNTPKTTSGLKDAKEQDEKLKQQKKEKKQKKEKDDWPYKNWEDCWRNYKCEIV